MATTNTQTVLDMSQRHNMTAEIVAAMREAYEEEGIEGDFDDAYTYLVYVAPQEELEAEFTRWVENKG